MLDQPAQTTPDDATPTMPRWMKGFVIAAALLAVLVLVLLLTGGGGQHGPGRHSGLPAPAVGQNADTSLVRA